MPVPILYSINFGMTVQIQYSATHTVPVLADLGHAIAGSVQGACIGTVQYIYWPDGTVLLEYTPYSICTG